MSKDTIGVMVCVVFRNVPGNVGFVFYLQYSLHGISE